jgi:uncharacterized lipoprotein YmbA
MNRFGLRGALSSAIATLALMLAACASGPPPEYYRLDDEAAATPERSAATPEVIAVAGVSVPDRVDRAQIVVEDGGRRDIVASGHRWSAPLGVLVERMLVRRLQAARPAAWIETERSGPAPPAAMRAILVIDEFAGRLGGEVVVSARWEVRDLRHDHLRLGDITVRANAAGPGYDALAAAFAGAVRQVCDAVAAEIDQLPPD